MRVLICHRPSAAFGYISDGWLNAMHDAGIAAERWDGKLETWSKFKPDLYLGCSGHRQPIPAKRGSCKVAIHANPRCEIRIEPGINEAEEAVRWVHTQQPNAVFGYGFECQRKFWSGWDKAGISWVPMPTGADAVVFKPTFRPRARDVVYLGGRWDYKAKSIDKFLLPLLQRPNGLSFKLYGWGNWPAGICSGELPISESYTFLASGKVGPCVSEPHTLSHGIDLPERVFKVALSGTVAVHDGVPGLGQILPYVPNYSDPEQYRNEIRRLINDDAARNALAKDQVRMVLREHTYHSRLLNLFRALSLDCTAMQSALERMQQRAGDWL